MLLWTGEGSGGPGRLAPFIARLQPRIFSEVDFRGALRPDRCRACNEELRRHYDAEEDCWVFKGVLRVNPAGQTDEHGRILVHRKCFQPGNQFAGDVTSPVPVTPRPGGPGQQWVSVKSEGGVV